MPEPKSNAKPSSRRRGCLAVLLGFVLVLILLIVTNVLVGIMAHDRINRRVAKSHARLNRVLVSGKDVRTCVVTRAGSKFLIPWRGLTYRVRVNKLGFRGPEINENLPEDSWRIVCVGDSSTFGLWVEDERTYVRRLEVILNNWVSRDKFESINMGQAGRTSHTGMLDFNERGLNLKPNIVIIAFGSNDSTSIDLYNFGFLAKKPDKEL